MQNLSLSIIVPCFNEAKNIDIFYSTIKHQIIDENSKNKHFQMGGGFVVKVIKLAILRQIPQLKS